MNQNKTRKTSFFRKYFLFEKDSIAPDELVFMDEVDAAMHRRGSVWAYRFTLFLLGLFVLLLTLSCIIEREEVTRGEGHIIFSRGVQPIQAPDGGIVIDVLVKENQIVPANATLARISNTQAAAEYQDLLNKEADYSLALKRLTAEREGKEPEFSDEDRSLHPFVVRDQMRLYTARMQRFQGEKRELEALLEQKRREVEGSQLTRQHTEKSLLLLKQQEEQVRPLVGRGAYSEMDYLKLKQRIVAQEAELNGLAQTISRAQSAVREAEGRLSNLEPERLSKIADEMNNYAKELRAVKEGIVARENRVDRSELKSPMRGVIRRILLKEDSVVRQAETVMELLPLDDSLEVEARFRPEDRGFLARGQNATIKISAYDFAIYGGLSATVENISGDTIEDNKGRPWYSVRLKTTNSTLPGKDDLEVKVGMTVTVDVFSGKKSIFNYLMKPLLKSRLTSNVVRHNMTSSNATHNELPTDQTMPGGMQGIPSDLQTKATLPANDARESAS